MRAIRLVIVVFWIAAGCAQAQQQSQPARIYGSVTKATGISAGKIELRIVPVCECKRCVDPKKCDCCPNQITATTDEQGHFDIELSPGKYTLYVERRAIAVEVSPGESKNINVSIE